MDSSPELGEKLQALEGLLGDLRDRRRFRKFEFWTPYPKQREHMRKGATFRERLLSAGNQQGKSETGAFETSVHLTGLYPPWWDGRVWKRPVRAWADGETSLLVRDTQQKKLCGAAGVDSEFGTGFIPKEAFVDKSLARGVTDAFDTIQVRHYRSDGTPDGVSTLTFKSYEQGRQKHQSEPIDFDWMDEEAPADVYSEILTRTNATGGMVFTTFTPLKGMSEVAARFFRPDPGDPGHVDRALTQMTIDDAEHIPLEERKKIIASYAPHERDARTRGIPLLGSGRVFPYPEDLLRETGYPRVPAHWFKLWAVDFGIDHPFAAVLLLWDKDADVIHIHHTYRVSGLMPLMHAQAMKKIAGGVPVVWPHDGMQRREGGGGAETTIAKQYRSHGLKMQESWATFPDGGYSTEAGVMLLQQYMETGRFRVADHLHDWFDEFRLYHRKDGMIVKLADDLMSATRIGVMARRFARAVPLGPVEFKRRSNGGMCSGLDMDLFTGR